MLLRDFLPAPEVREFIQCYRIVHFNFDNFKEIPFKAYPPKPEQCLHFFLTGYFAIQEANGNKKIQPSVLFSGQRTGLVNQYQGRTFFDVQIVFQPAAVFRLTRIPAYELIDLHLDADCLFPKQTQIVLDQLRGASGYSTKIHIIDTFVKRLIGQVKVDPIPLDVVSRQLRLNNESHLMDELANRSFLSARQFERKFLERVGVNPKQFAGIVRFNKAFNMRNRYPYKTWSDVSMASGYHDYQHLAKDYMKFAGMSPADLHRLETNSPENLLDLSRALYHSRWMYGRRRAGDALD